MTFIINVQSQCDRRPTQLQFTSLRGEILFSATQKFGMSQGTHQGSATIHDSELGEPEHIARHLR